MFQTFLSLHNSNFLSDKLVLTSVTPASSAPVLQTPKATSSTLYFDSLTVNGGNGGVLRFFFQAADGIRAYKVTGVQTCALPISTFAALMGALPIMVGTGAGAELRQPLGYAVFGGLLLSQLLTLYISPVIYIYLDRVDRMLKRRLEPQLEEVPELHPRPEVVAAE